MQEPPAKKSKTEDLEVTGISRSGRVRKKSSKLMDFESPDDIETRFRKLPVKTYGGFRSSEMDNEFGDSNGHMTKSGEVDIAGGSGSESDYYDNSLENPDSMESDSSGSDDASMRTPANSLYMMEKSTKKKLIVKDGKVVGRAKAQRKDKGKTRITAYMMWSKEARNDLLRKYPEMDFAAVSKRLGEMWANVNYNERYLWKRRAKRYAIQKDQGLQPPPTKILSATKQWTGQVGRPPSNRTPHKQASSNALQQAQGGTNVAMYRVTGCGAIEVSAHLRLLGESLAIIGERLKEHEGQIAVSGSVSVLLDTLLCSLAPLICITRAIPLIAPPAELLRETLHNIAYIMPGL